MSTTTTAKSRTATAKAAPKKTANETAKTTPKSTPKTTLKKATLKKAVPKNTAQKKKLAPVSGSLPLDRVDWLHRTYLGTLVSGGNANHVAVIHTRNEIEARARVLMGTLSSAGIGDISTLGRMRLRDDVRVRPGVQSAGPVRPVPIEGGIGDITQPSRPRFRTLAASDPATARKQTTLRTASTPAIAIDEAIIVAEDLELADGTVLELDPSVRHLTILALRMTVGTGCSIRWSPAVREKPAKATNGDNGRSYDHDSETSASAFRSPAGGDGERGSRGHTGAPGQDAPTIEVWAMEANRMPRFDLHGGAGGPGGNGGNGGRGGNGAKGRDADANFLKCVREVGWGGDAGAGGDAGPGGAGGRGGAGGDVALYLPDAVHEAVLAASLRIDNAGGAGGAGGAPGAPGMFGVPGLAGDPRLPACGARPERMGAVAAIGAPGTTGSGGATGDLGMLTVIVITPDEFRDTWTDPQIGRIVPHQVHAGDTVQIHGANFTRGMTATFADVTVPTDYVSDALLTAVVPSLPAGQADVEVRSGADVSNLAAVTVLASVLSVTPSPARVGQQVTIVGSGFAAGSRVLFRNEELVPDQITGTSMLVTLPAPPAPFEDPGGLARLSVRGADGVVSASFDLRLRPVIDTGFDVTVNGYRFSNSPTGGFANLKTFTKTYGWAEVDAQWVLHPVLTGAWFAYFVDFFNRVQPGYSTGFATTAAEAYWGGEGNLWGRWQRIQQVEANLVIAQGHVLSAQILPELARQAATGVRRARTSADEVASAFRSMIGMSLNERRAIAPITQLMPAGTILTPEYISKLGNSHGLLPIRIEYPVGGESWDIRMVVYDNATPYGAGFESHIDITGSGGDTSFAFIHEGPGGATSVDTRNSSDGWTLSQLSLERCLLSDVDMPTSFLVILSPATAVVEDAQGRRLGVAGRERFGDLPGAFAAQPNLYVLPDDEDLRVTIHGTGSGTYHLALVNGAAGTSTALWDVPVTAGTVDELTVTGGSVSMRTRGAARAATIVHGRADGEAIHAVRLTDVPLSGDAVTLTVNPDLSEFAVESTAPATISLALLGRTADATVTSKTAAVELGGRREFRVPDWSKPSLGAG